MDYKERLRAFNSTEKYKREVELLNSLLYQGGAKLDYGCGLGITMRRTHAFGFDVNDYLELNYREGYFLNTLPDAYFD